MKNSIRVFKNRIAQPTWIVEFRELPIGSSDDPNTAQIAAQLAARHIKTISPHNPINVCPSYLIDIVDERMKNRGLGAAWAATPMGHISPSTHLPLRNRA